MNITKKMEEKIAEFLHDYIIDSINYSLIVEEKTFVDDDGREHDDWGITLPKENEELRKFYVEHIINYLKNK